ncbi:amidohydrolase [Betaproteobacteria bacterium]|nr:amidohydrolase [Betaproteobacteria bacterium]
MQYEEYEKHVARFIGKERDRFTALSDEIWGYAEIGYEEHRSAATQKALLEHFGFRVSDKLAGMSTAFLGEAGHGEPVIAFLGEFDALPGLDQEAGNPQRAGNSARNGHACGHHLLGTGALAAAVATADFLGCHGLPGRVRYYGCPAEENGVGKAFLARGGYFADVDAALTWHPGASTGIMTGPILANIQVYFRFTGRAAHASNAAHLGRSALDAVELMNVGVNYLREHMPPEARVHYAITDSGGHAPNVVQAHAEALYLVRSPSAAELKALYQRVCQIAQGAALMTGTTLEIAVDKASAEMLHNQALEKWLSEIVAKVGAPVFDEADQTAARGFQASLSKEDLATGKRKFLIPADYAEALADRPMPYQASHPSVGGSTDVADVSWIVPTAQIWGPCFAIGTPGHSWQNTAQGKSTYAHKGMLHTAKILALAAIELLRTPEILAAAKKEIEESIRQSGLPNLLPAEVNPPRRDKTSFVL